MTVTASCHCQAVRIEMDQAPTDINDCQCEHCQKRGVMWSYYSPRSVRVSGATSSYSWGPKHTVFHFCTNCGCTTHWTAADPKRDRMGVNVRLMSPEHRAGATVRQSPGPR